MFIATARVLLGFLMLAAPGFAADPVPVVAGCIPALEPTVINGLASQSLWQLPRVDRLALEELVSRGEFARWYQISTDGMHKSPSGKYRYQKIPHAQGQISLIINMNHYLLPLVASADGSIRHASTGEIVVDPYHRSSLWERMKAWLSVPQNLTKVKRGVAIAAIAGTAITVAVLYSQNSDADWYDGGQPTGGHAQQVPDAGSGADLGHE